MFAKQNKLRELFTLEISAEKGTCLQIFACTIQIQSKSVVYIFKRPFTLEISRHGRFTSDCPKVLLGMLPHLQESWHKK